MDANVLKRFESKFMPVPYIGCWIWVGGLGPKGYGSFSPKGKTQRAHRVSYTHFVGKIPNGMYVLHKCDNPALC